MDDNNEGWNAYRKLILETLKRLDKAIENIQNDVNLFRSKIESAETKDDIDHENVKRLEALVNSIEKDITSIKTKLSNNSIKLNMWFMFGTVIWNVLIAIIEIWLNWGNIHQTLPHK